MVEYLNPFCTHCRATHARLERLLESGGAPVRRHRVYVWATDDPPLWAKVVAYAQTTGQEDAFFHALASGPTQESDKAIWAAVARAGLDRSAVTEFVRRGDWQGRLQWERGRVMQSRIEGLPTFDVGRRRLQGEQSESELRDALDAALSDQGLARLR
jgi:predicted DsbA family dithiol-disulfide isomerase